jgi:hypothetical protein
MPGLTAETARATSGTGQPRTVALVFMTRWIFAWVCPDADHRPSQTSEPVNQWHARIRIGLVLGLAIVRIGRLASSPCG